MKTAEYFQKPTIQINDADGSCLVVEKIEVKVRNGDMIDYFVIPKNYRCDSASIAPILRGLVSKYNATNAGIVHDYMYSTRNPSRKRADLIFYLLLRRTKMCWLSCRAAWLAVRLFGWLFYAKNSPVKNADA